MIGGLGTVRTVRIAYALRESLAPWPIAFLAWGVCLGAVLTALLPAAVLTAGGMAVGIAVTVVMRWALSVTRRSEGVRSNAP